MIVIIGGDARILSEMRGAAGLQNTNVSEAERVDAHILHAEKVGEGLPPTMKYLDPLLRQPHLS